MSQNNSNSRLPRSPFLFLRLLALLMLVFVVVYLLVYNFMPYKTQIFSFQSVWRNSDCGKILFYDGQGIGHDLENIHSSINAPLYFVNDDNIVPEVDGCKLYPETLPMQVVSNGKKIFPAKLTISTSENWIRQGSSIVMTSTLALSQVFTENNNLPFVVSQSGNAVRFQIDAPNFEYSPSNKEIVLIPINMNTPATMQWIIAPIGRALGNQFINIRVLENQFPLKMTSKIEIRRVIGIDEKVLAVLITLGLCTKSILDMIKTFIEIRNDKSKKKK